jgi:cytochrome b
MKRELVYDLPTRIFHWMFACLFLTAFVITKAVDDESAVFSYHMLAGLVLSLLVTLRIIYGIWGTKHARFSGFALNPKDLFNYFKGILSGSKTKWAGHNPASSWAAILMIAMAAGLGLTGYLMTSGPDKETFEDIHELLANGLLVVAVLHIAGIVLHTLRHKEVIGLSMIDGKKTDIATNDVISSSLSGLGVLLLGMVVVFAFHLNRNYDAKSGTLQLLGATLQLGENDGSDDNGNGDDEDED